MAQYTIICGPTASGKSAVALQLAKKYSAAIINADAFQVYSGIEVITASPTCENKKDIPHFLYNYVNYKSNFSLFEYISAFKKTIETIESKFDHIFIVGGTGMYIKAIMEGINLPPKTSDTSLTFAKTYIAEKGIENFYSFVTEIDPVSRGKIKKNDTQRLIRAYAVFIQTGKSIFNYHDDKKYFLLQKTPKVIFLYPERNFLYEICNLRIKDIMMDKGLVELRNINTKNDYQSFNAIGIKEFLQYLNKNLSFEEALAISQQRTRNYAKRQITWFKNQIKTKQILQYSSVEELYKLIDKTHLSKFLS